MRIAIPIEPDGQVAHHVGHAPAYLIADVEGNEIVKTAQVPNPGHGPGGPPPHFLKGIGVDEVVGWAMPSHAKEIFANLGVKTILGAQGEAKAVLGAYLNGTLTLTDDTQVEGCDHA